MPVDPKYVARLFLPILERRPRRPARAAVAVRRRDGRRLGDGNRRPWSSKSSVSSSSNVHGMHLPAGLIVTLTCVANAHTVSEYRAQFVQLFGCEREIPTIEIACRVLA